MTLDQRGINKYKKKSFPSLNYYNYNVFKCYPQVSCLMRGNTHYKRMGHCWGREVGVKSHQLLHLHHQHHHRHHRIEKVQQHAHQHRHHHRSHSHLYHSSVPVYYSVVVLTMLVVTVGDLFIGPTLGSEFPERECCDNLYPIPAPGPVPRENGIDPALPEYVASTPPATTEPAGRHKSFQTKTASAIMNCIQARDSCMNHTACHPILEVVPRVCGAEKVACSTVTITKCQAALRTLQAFPYFFPTCLCREPSSDPACNTFRDYLFDHPCSIVAEKEKDPYPVHALPTCDYALDVCRKENKCIKLYHDFKTHCKQSDDKCLMVDGEMCHDAWTRLRLSPMFGCICPKVSQKCERIFKEVNYNPCVASETLAALASTSTALFSLEQHRLAGMSAHFNFSPAALFAPNTAIAAGSFLESQYRARHHAAAAHNSLMIHSSRHQHHNFHQHKHSFSPGTRVGHGSSYYEDPGHNAILVAQHGPVGPPLPQPPPRSPAPSHFSLTNNAIIPAARTESHLSVDESLSTPISYHGYPSPGSFTTTQSGSITVQVISSSHAPDDSQLETPLLGPQGGRGGGGINKPPPFVPIATQTGPPFSKHHRDEVSRPQLPQSPSVQQPRLNGAIATISSIRPHGNSRTPSRMQYANTCYTALQNCRRNLTCNGLLEKVINFCDPMRCRQDTCMKALQNFYREADRRWALEVAFCICKKTDNRYDQCILAQEQLHPVCAQRGDLGANLPSCNSLAQSCRTQHDCRVRLQEYEQACAVDSVTRKCAGPTAECRNAMIHILGTKLRFFCGCNGTDVIQLYDCLDWQRILWVNPCVVESHLDYHRMRQNISPVPRSTTTTSQIPTETEYYNESVPGNDVLSTPLGIPRLPQHRNETPVSTYSSSTHSSTVTARIRHPRPHPDGEGHRNPHNTHHGRNGARHQIVTEETVPVAPRVVPSHESSTSVTTIGSREITTSEEVTTISTTTGRTEPATTTQPPKFCYVGRPKQPEQKIREGTSKRLYREEQPSCSELCACSLGGEQAAICAVLDCLETKPCPSRVGDVWHHGAPKYIAHRGACICYAGRFICEKPDKSLYTLANGVFLFLGYSMLDESVLKKHTKLSVKDVVAALQILISPETNHLFFYPEDEVDPALEGLRSLNATDCQLGLYKIEGENIIINATIAEEDFADSRTRQPIGSLFLQEKKKCLPALTVLEQLINNQHPLIRHHQLLSILKVAITENNIPDVKASAQSTFALFSSLVANPCSLILFVVTIHVAASYMHLLLLAATSIPPILSRHKLLQSNNTSCTTTTTSTASHNRKQPSHHQHDRAAGQLVPPLTFPSTLLLQLGSSSSNLMTTLMMMMRTSITRRKTTTTMTETNSTSKTPFYPVSGLDMS
ncbi:unnamed protein product [Orchesella dallaii]|uniref:GDNF/GAS1 domain-containing protein n=1 Tax=Orchesella dallaii TaxID=48710 RepID=A0ABP1QTX3_9HEXA